VIELYRRLVGLKGNEPKARLLLAKALERAGRLEEAESEFATTIELAPMEMQSYRSMASFEMARGQPEAAIEVYRTAIARMPDEPKGYLFLGELYEELERTGNDERYHASH